MRTLLELGENTLGTKQSKKSNTPTLAKRKKERKKKTKFIVHAAVAHWLAQNNFYSQLCSSPILA
jgi:hypothetical protein